MKIRLRQKARDSLKGYSAVYDLLQKAKANQVLTTVDEIDFNAIRARVGDNSIADGTIHQAALDVGLEVITE